MKLNLKILWFDDQPKEVLIYKKRIADHLLRKGFRLQIHEVDKVKDFKSILPDLISGGEPDLILLDWNMGQGTKKGTVNGATIARTLRSTFRHQSIVFYSAASPKELRNEVYERGIDGVFCVNRQNLAAEVTDVIDTMLQKLLDINQMRGIVISHVGQIDIMVSDCLKKFWDCSNGDAQHLILENFYNNIKKFHESKLKGLSDNFTDHSLADYEKMSVLAVRYRVLRKMLSDHAPSDRRMDSILKTLGLFEEDILVHRNALAHAIEEVIAGREILKYKDTIYDDKKMTEIRLALMHHTDNFQNIFDSIKCGRFNKIDSV